MASDREEEMMEEVAEEGAEEEEGKKGRAYPRWRDPDFPLGPKGRPPKAGPDPEELEPQETLPAPEGQTAKLKLTHGREVEVQVLGEERFGMYAGKIHLCPIYSFEAIEWWADRIMSRIRQDFDQVICITGQEGSGKSSLALHLASRIDPDLDTEHIVFTAAEFRKRIAEAFPGETVILDEAGQCLFSRDWATKAQKDLIRAFMAFRAKRLKIILVLPHLQLLDYALRNRRVEWWAHVREHAHTRGWARIRKSMHNEWTFGCYWEPLFALRFPRFEGELWKDYLQKKMEFLDRELRK